MTASGPRQGSRLAMIVGLAAFTGGLWLLLNALGVGIAPFKDLWPILFVFAGAGMLADYLFLSRRPGSAGWALAWFGFGVLFFALTLNYTTWGKILDWLPSIPTILGLALLTTWFADHRRDDNQIIAGGILLGLGLVGFAARFDWLQRILPSAQVVWAVLLLAGGGFLVWRNVIKAKR